MRTGPRPTASLTVLLGLLAGRATGGGSGEAGQVILFVVLTIGLVVLGVYLFKRNGHFP